jgi:hypothetical protein
MQAQIHVIMEVVRLAGPDSMITNAITWRALAVVPGQLQIVT